MVLHPYLSRWSEVKERKKRAQATGEAGEVVWCMFRHAYEMGIALATVRSSVQSESKATNTFRYHSSLAVSISSLTASIPLSALFITTSHISPILSLQAFSFSSDTSSSYPSMVSRHRLEAAAISPSGHSVAFLGKLWYSLSAEIRRKEACVGNGEQYIIQSLDKHVSGSTKVSEV